MIVSSRLSVLLLGEEITVKLFNIYQRCYQDISSHLLSCCFINQSSWDDDIHQKILLTHLQDFPWTWKSFTITTGVVQGWGRFFLLIFFYISCFPLPPYFRCPVRRNRGERCAKYTPVPSRSIMSKAVMLGSLCLIFLLITLIIKLRRKCKRRPNLE